MRPRIMLEHLKMRNKILVAAAFCLATAGYSTLAQACPDYTISGETYQASGSEFYTPRTFEVIAGGDTRLTACPHIDPLTDVGSGYVMTRPDFTFSLSGMSAYTLEISVVSKCDSMLLVNTGRANWYYDDDDNGNYDPKIVLTRPSDGWLDIWVGTYDGQYCNAILRMETFYR